MFSLDIHWAGILITEILKVVQKCKICHNKGHHESWGPRHLTKKNYSGGWDSTILKICLGFPGGRDGNAWN